MTEFWSDFFAAWFEAYPEPSDGDNDLLMFLNKEKKKVSVYKFICRFKSDILGTETENLHHVASRRGSEAHCSSRD